MDGVTVTVREPDKDEQEIIYNVAQSFRRSYSQIDVDDVYQSLMLRWYERFERFSDYLSLPEEEKRPLLIRTFTNLGIDYCRREVSELAKLHPNTDDFYGYSRVQIQKMLPFVEDLNAWSSLAAGERTPGAKQDPALGGNMLAHYADLRTAWDVLSGSDRSLLRLKFVEGLEYVEIEEKTGLSEANGRKRVERAVSKMQKAMGCDVRGRKAMSNAAAQVATRRGYEGE